MAQPTFIEIYKDAMSKTACERAMKAADDICNREDKGRGFTFSDDDSRKDENIFIHHYQSMETTRRAIVAAVENCFEKYNNKYNVTGRDFVEVFDPTVKIQRAHPDGGFFSWHTEQGSSESTRNRFAVWMIYLNDVAEGGRTQFKFQNINVQPVAGSCVIWPAAYTHLHRSSPDLKQMKYIATGWFTYGDKKSGL